mgnify:CR=1 FL=1
MPDDPVSNIEKTSLPSRNKARPTRCSCKVAADHAIADGGRLAATTGIRNDDLWGTVP